MLLAAGLSSLGCGLVILHYWVLLVPLGWLIWRLIVLVGSPGRWLVMLISIMFGVRAWIWQESQIQLTHSPQAQVSQMVVVQPDQWKVNGDFVQAIGQGKRQKYLIQAYLKEPSQQKYLESLHEPVQVTIKGDATPISPATNFNEFDRRFWYRTQGVQMVIKGQLINCQPVKDHSLVDCLHQLRHQLATYFHQLPTPLSGYALRLLIGLQDPATDEQMTTVKQLGLIHLFCLSGLHVASVCLLVQGGGRIIGYDRHFLNWILIVTLPLYWVIGGGSLSLTRAILMIECQLWSQQFGRNQPDAWAISLLIQEFIQPTVLMSLGGQLSYLLSFALCWFDWQKVKWQSFKLGALGLPPLLHFVFEFHLLSLVINYLMIPFFSWIIFPGTMISTLLYPFLPGISGFFNHLLEIFDQSLVWLAKFPGMIHFGKIGVLLTLTLLIITWWAIEHATGRSWMILLLCYLGIYLGIHRPLSGEVTFVDIGQGDCIIIREPFNHRVMLIDTGGDLQIQKPAWARGHFSRDRSVGTSINYLKSLGIYQLDSVWLTHSDADHIGFLTTVMKNFRVKQILVPAGMETLPKFQSRLAYPVKVVPVTNQSSPMTDLQILHPMQVGSATNDDSLVLFGHFGKLRFLFMGDLPQNGEKLIMKQYPNLQADILKLGHHGSKTSSNLAFLKQVQPHYGIISAGRRNRYHHPNLETMQRLQQSKIVPLSTQNYGMIRYRYYGFYDQLTTKLNGDEKFWISQP